MFSTGHVYPAIATFGLPCPTTLFTIGLMAFAVPPYSYGPLLVPVLWCFVGAQAAFVLDVTPDLGLIAAALVGIGLMVRAKSSLAAEKASVSLRCPGSRQVHAVMRSMTPNCLHLTLPSATRNSSSFAS